MSPGAAPVAAGEPVRTLAVCCAQWPVVATGRPLAVPVAVVHANRVVSVSPAARAEGVAVGLRRREAQSRCPGVEVVEADPSRDARAFEAVLGALDDIAPRWEVTEPGRCAVPALGPSRYHGGDRALADKVRAVVAGALLDALGDAARGVSIGVGVTDGPRAAAVVAEEVSRDRSVSPVAGRAAGSAGTAASAGSGGALPGPGGVTVVAPGATATHLATMPVGNITSGGSGWGRPAELDELVDVLRRLGLKNLGRFAALEPTDVLARFGPLGRSAHDFARGDERTLMVLGDTPLDLRVTAAIDPPAEQVDRAAFAAKVLADGLHGELAARGLACTRVLVVAETEVGDRIERLWRHEGTLSATAIAQRVRWQLEGWLATGRSLGRCRGGVSRIELVPDEVVPDDGRQVGFWGGSSEVGERAVRALARVQALLGHDAVVVPEWRGGRGPGERFRPVPLEMVDLDARVGRDDTPWPGSLPSPAPAVVWPSPAAAELLDAEGRRVAVGGRGLVSAPPARCAVAGGPWAEVRAWAGPWCVDERWWDPVAHRRRARIQAVLARGDESAAHLLTLESGRWWLEATYD